MFEVKKTYLGMYIANYQHTHHSNNFQTGVTVLVCKRFEFVIRSVNNVKMARYKIVNQYENGYG